MSTKLEQFITPDVFAQLASRLGIGDCVLLLACDPNGRVVYPEGTASNAAVREARALAVSEALRWGEPTILTAPGHMLIWAVPVMVNAELLGGLLMEVDESRAFGGSFDAARAARALRELAEEHNLTNAALLATHRAEHDRERRRAEAIHEVKMQSHYSLRRTYMQEEPELVAAIRQGDLGTAREIINRLLVVMSHRATGNFELAKSFFMELVITMVRTAVEVGGSVEELLGANYANIVDLARMSDYEQVAPWLHGMLESLMESIRAHARKTAPVLISSALRYMEEHLGEGIMRDDVAEVCHMSPTHFSRTFRDQVGRTFVDVLNRMRVDQAAELLVRTDKELALIALECGFNDQSYFTKVFRKYKGKPPGEYRRRRRPGADTQT